MKKILFWTSIVSGIVFLCWVRIKMDQNTDEMFCQEIEQNDSFDGHEVDKYYNWKIQGAPSKRFKELYQKKIKHLPGWTP